MGRSGVRADVSGAQDWLGLLGRAVAKEGGGERERERGAHLRIILANCVHVSTRHWACPPSTRKKLRAPLPCCSIKYAERKYNYCLSGNIPHGITRGAAFQAFRVS